MRDDGWGGCGDRQYLVVLPLKVTDGFGAIELACGCDATPTGRCARGHFATPSVSPVGLCLLRCETQVLCDASMLLLWTRRAFRRTFISYTLIPNPQTDLCVSNLIKNAAVGTGVGSLFSLVLFKRKPFRSTGLFGQIVTLSSYLVNARDVRARRVRTCGVKRLRLLMPVWVAGKAWPITLGLGVAFGMSYAECNARLRDPRPLQAD